MKYRRLGNSGLQVSLAGLGTNNFGGRLDYEGTASVVDAAIDAGINFFDTADIYGGGLSEEYLGRALGGRREDVLIATKFAMPMGEGPFTRGGSRHYIERAVAASLRRLGTDYIDVYQMHQSDADTPIEETLEALTDLVHRGVVRYIGHSNFSGWQIADADWTARSKGLARFVSAQNEWSLLERKVEPEIMPACREFGLGQLPFFPLASGFLTGKYRRGEKPAGGHAAGGLAEGDAGADRRADGGRELRPAGGAGGLRRGARAHDPRPRAVLAGQRPGGLVGDRGGDQARADRGERGRDAGLGAERGGVRGGRRAALRWLGRAADGRVDSGHRGGGGVGRRVGRLRLVGVDAG